MLGAASLMVYGLTRLSIMSYNIMDSGFADESGKYDPVGDRIPGNLTDFMAATSPFVPSAARQRHRHASRRGCLAATVT